MVVNVTRRVLRHEDAEALSLRAISDTSEAQVLRFADDLIERRAARGILVVTHIRVAVAFLARMKLAADDGAVPALRVGIISDGDLQASDRYTNGVEFLAGMRSDLGSRLTHAMLLSANDDLLALAAQEGFHTEEKKCDLTAPSLIAWYRSFIDGRPW
ncbi:hypothetical protein A3D73_00055 [Candidatus Uhrbacteria bacterium RIFCSPHIGHO2_02_FULL_60_44]|nr:MAG: hypothetical protein A3D73_00055 [Candidatus Uhrbacteria bacterium RIFCSPHIGHO2_02_FULL_60_44]